MDKIFYILLFKKILLEKIGLNKRLKTNLNLKIKVKKKYKIKVIFFNIIYINILKTD